MSLAKHLILRVAACLSAACLVVGCDFSERRAQAALNDYQAAAASNDIVGARRALLKLVSAKDDVPEYWTELAQLEMTSGDWGQAYYAYSRAYELDRRNTEVLRNVTVLALRNGDLAGALKHASDLEVLAPDDPWVKLTRGWAAISETQFEKAIAASDQILANSPFDSSATVLKARGLVGLGRIDEAADLLEKQIEAQPSAGSSLKMLARIYERSGDWARVAKTAQALHALTPSDQDNLLLLIEAAFRSGNISLGRQASSQLIQLNGIPSVISSVLDIWGNFWRSGQKSEDAFSLGSRTTSLDQKLVYARYLSLWGSAQNAARLAASAATLPISAENAEANAVLADAWARQGNLGAAKARFDAVLAYDSGNSTALRGRTDLFLRAGNAPAALRDAQKLVSVAPGDAGARLLLAKSFMATGNRAWADRTLWAAFQEIPANDEIFAALLATRKGNGEATRELQEEFARQRDATLGQGFA